MRRREFLALAGAAAVFPRVALGQQAKVARVAYLSIPTRPVALDAVRQALAGYGYVVGTTLVFDTFTAPTNNDLPTFASQAVASKPDVLLTTGTPATIAAKNATTSIPIVFTAANDPVTLGLVASLAHPGGNVTGVSTTAPDMAGKQLAIMKEVLPSLTQVVVLNLPADPAISLVTASVLEAVPNAGLRATTVNFVETEDFAKQLSQVSEAGGQAVYVPASLYFNSNTDLLNDFELKSKLMLLWGTVLTPFAGVLGYGIDVAATDRTAAAMVDMILKGARPADVPVQEPTEYDFAVNLATAKAIGITIPASVLAQATIVTQ